jgi:hypothetical protein
MCSLHILQLHVPMIAPAAAGIKELWVGSSGGVLCQFYIYIIVP